MNEKRELLRHTVAAVAYRATRALEDAPEHFGTFAAAGRTPVQILAHMGDLFDWALSVVQFSEKWSQSTCLPWNDEVRRFFEALQAFDAAVAGWRPEPGSMERLLQGPIADALTHVGQLAMLRRLAGIPCKGENFYLAVVTVGRVGSDQSAPAAAF